MYKITDKEIEFINDDLIKKGITIMSLREDIIDHICCLAENELAAHGDFRKFYLENINKFYTNDISELQAETILLQNKNYPIMKKAMIISGSFSVAAMLTGCFFKLMHWPAAAFLLISGIFIFTFIFLPIVYLLKSGQTSPERKLKLFTGGIVCMLYSLFIVFLVQHWPGGNWLIFSAIGISFFVYIPLYFFTGIKNPEAKLNTIVNTVLLVAVTSLQFTLMKIY